jgi:hypothetical protein
LAHLCLKDHLLPTREARESLMADFREMRKQIVTTFVRRDEPKAIRIVKPLDCAVAIVFPLRICRTSDGRLARARHGPL